MTPEQRFEYIERNIQIITDLVVQGAERQSTTEHQLQQLGERMDQLGERMTELTVTMNRLANIVIRHEERLDSLDGEGAL